MDTTTEFDQADQINPTRARSQHWNFEVRATMGMHAAMNKVSEAAGTHFYQYHIALDSQSIYVADTLIALRLLFYDHIPLPIALQPTFVSKIAGSPPLVALFPHSCRYEYSYHRA